MDRDSDTLCTTNLCALIELISFFVLLTVGTRLKKDDEDGFEAIVRFGFPSCDGLDRQFETLKKKINMMSLCTLDRQLGLSLIYSFFLPLFFSLSVKYQK